MQLPPQLSHTSQHCIHPSPRKSGISPASITDTALAELTPTGAAWYFPAPASGSYDPVLLTTALEATLAIYPQLCGALSLTPPNNAEYPPHTRRYGRVWVRWGDDEPGLLLTQAKWGGPLADVLPMNRGNEAISSAVMPNIFALLRLRPSALGPACPGPAAVAQITAFNCGGVALALAAQHALLDAHALAYVLRDWGTIHTAMLRGAPQPTITRTYAPMDLDAHACADTPGPQLEELANTVPQLRLDFWAYDPSDPNDQAPGAAGRPRGPRAPFETWDADAAVGDAVLDLSAADVARLSTPGVSALDGVLGAAWRAVVRARELDSEVWMHGCVGLRTRLGLPDDFQGAPLINVSAGLDAKALLGNPGAGARAIRAGIKSVTKDRASAVLHHMANALDPAREWNVFVGSRNILSTSWLGIGAYAADFGYGTAARVHPFMPPVDGIIVVMEAKEAGVEHGARGGVSLRLLLREEVLARVLSDPELVGK
ncbi:hypothetical protein CC85DRAFT_251822 [Cutaneotrichosporon oleaginosum]|uniref:Transferase-domain-containing protein n=1 Tax=Cutaneotrichosporon oleaginosum TaxID=879819 RepID=A0A0J0XDE3_9TREE|nr:uncharacterized protein CC85DRAFT_251822 [Cutaneotrichosporon oleaginosum]KLT39053.1 hypothetical protein CC85DRAFT_251822 [Cutaneotrichosporon oleaginosum]TXT11837.1 hypothetical protein COLE_02247 [Cutaneotrichosporon oleaginosum]